MSVFQKLKDTFQIAHQDLVDGLRSFSFADQQRQEEFHNLYTREINLDAGADLLHRYQSNWSSIQSKTNKSAQEAEEVAKCIASVFKTWDQHAEAAKHLEQESKAMSSIVTSMAQMHKLLDDLCQDCLTIEKSLDQLENVCEEHEFNNRCHIEMIKLAHYSAKKNADADQIKVNLAYKHARNAAKIESTKKINLQERAEAFMSAFQDDIKYYRKHGHPDRFPPNRSLVSSLSAVELDQDREALNMFLGPDGELINTGKLEISDEESYIEDDYIIDYSVKPDADFLGDDEDYTNANFINEIDMEDILKENQIDLAMDDVFQEKQIDLTMDEIVQENKQEADESVSDPQITDISSSKTEDTDVHDTVTHHLGADIEKKETSGVETS